MSAAVQQFVEIVRQEYALIEFGKLEQQEIMLNIADAELNGEITQEQAEELRRLYT